MNIFVMVVASLTSVLYQGDIATWQEFNGIRPFDTSNDPRYIESLSWISKFLTHPSKALCPFGNMTHDKDRNMECEFH